ncbi:MAG: Wzy polymerase domain-containing protein [Rubrivivax sp.]
MTVSSTLEGGLWPPSFIPAGQSPRPTLSLPALLGLVLLVSGPLVPNHQLPWATFYADALAIAGIGFLTLTWLGRRSTDRWPLAAVAALVLAAVPLAQAGGRVIFFWGDAWLACAYLCLLGFAIKCGYELTSDATKAETLIVSLAWLVLGSALVSASLALVQWLRLDLLGIFLADLPVGGRPYANFGQPNSLATWLMMGLASLVLLFEARRLGSATLLIAGVALTAGVAMTQSRTAWIEAAVLLIWFFFARRRVAFRLSPWWALAFAALLALLVGGWPAICDLLHLSAGRTLSEQTEDIRPELWRAMLDAIGRQPLLGYGWNQASVAQSAVAATREPIGGIIEHSHNLPVDLLVWNGVPLGLLLIGLIAWWLVHKARSVQDFFGALILVAVGMVLTHAMFEFPLDYAYFLLPVGLMVGVLERSAPLGRAVRISGPIAAGLAAVLAALVIWIAHDYREVQANTLQWRFESARIGPPPAKPSVAPDVALLTQQREFLRFARTQARRGMSADELTWMRQVAARFGYPPTLFRYALATALNDDPASSAEALARLCALHPPARCKEGLEAWTAMAAGPYPELRAVQFPALIRVGMRER